MITSKAMDGFYTHLSETMLAGSQLVNYIIGVRGKKLIYSDDLTFERVRMIIVETDADRKAANQPHWIMILVNRSSVKILPEQGRQFTAYNDTFATHMADEYQGRLATVDLKLAFVSDSISVMEDLEELLLVRDVRKSYTVNLPFVNGLVVSVDSFKVGELSKNTSTGGTILGLGASTTLVYPVFVYKQEIPTIETVHLHYSIVGQLPEEES